MTGKTSKRNSLRASLWLGVATLTMTTAQPVFAQSAVGQVDVPAQSLATTLTQIGRQTGAEVIFSAGDVRGRRAPAVKGSYSTEQALEIALRGSGLSVRRTAQGAYLIRAARAAASTDDAAASSAEEGRSASGDSSAAAIQEILVVGSRSQNADIRRTEDDAQPYVVFDAKEIQQSQATNVEEYLRARLPMNAAFAADSQYSSLAPRSSFDLRGLGRNQTLILIDGRRAPGVYYDFGDFQQPDINAIPINAIERIEILPATASGIYGGGATGGVINIVMRRDYTGVDVGATYGSAFDGKAKTFRADLSGGFNLFEGKTKVTFSGSHIKTSSLLAEDRPFTSRAPAQSQE